MSFAIGLEEFVMDDKGLNLSVSQTAPNGAEDGPLGGAMNAGLWVFAVVVAGFIISTVFDRDSLPIAGLTAGGVVAVGFFVARPRIGAVACACILLISMWAFAQCFWFGESLSGFARIVGVLALTFVIGGAPFSHSLVLCQLVSVIVATAMLAVPYYLGMYYLDGDGRWNFLGKSSNILALYLVAGAVGCLFVFRSSILSPGFMSFSLRLLAGAVFLLTIAPVASTGSRKGALLMILAPSLYLLLRMGIGKAALSIVILSVIAVLMVPVFASVLDFQLFDTLVYRFTETWEVGLKHRQELVENGLLAFKEKPWVGHGLDAPYYGAWLAEYIGHNPIKDIGHSTHNAYLNYLIMGGAPVFLLFISEPF